MADDTKQIDDGGPAFPKTGNYGDGPPEFDGENQDGMTLRDWFAGKAVQGLCASIGPNGVIAAEHAATFAYEIADAMLKARRR